MIDATKQKIDAIKAIRQFCFDTFGYTSGLKITKDFVDLFCNEINTSKLDKDIDYLVKKLLEAGYTEQGILDKLDRRSRLIFNDKSTF